MNKRYGWLIAKAMVGTALMLSRPALGLGQWSHPHHWSTAYGDATAACGALRST